MNLFSPLRAPRRRSSDERSKCSTSAAPPCTSPDDQVAKSCGFLGEQGCKHVDELRKRARRRTLEANLRAGKVPEVHWAAILSGDIDALAPIGAVRRVLAGELALIVLAGGPDAGKSFAAAWGVAERGGFWVTADTFDQFATKLDDVLKRCREAPWLAIDDVGAGRSTSQVAAPQLESLVRERFDRERPTVLTTNLTQANFWPLYGGECGRLASRAGPNGWVRCLERARRRNGRNA